jgi:hypothetical protein
MLHTPSKWPNKVLKHLPVGTCHRRIVESKPAVNMYSGGFGRDGSLGKSEIFVSGGGVEDSLRGADAVVEWL